MLNCRWLRYPTQPQQRRGRGMELLVVPVRVPDGKNRFPDYSTCWNHLLRTGRSLPDCQDWWLETKPYETVTCQASCLFWTVAFCTVSGLSGLGSFVCGLLWPSWRLSINRATLKSTPDCCFWGSGRPGRLETNYRDWDGFLHSADRKVGSYAFNCLRQL
jgi:hypothetical protein